MPLDPIYLSTAVEAAVAAGRVHLRYFRGDARIEKKGRIDLVTAADIEAEQMLTALIGERFPTHAVIGEESASGEHPTARFRWIVDPVDGTTNFAHGLGIFSVSIALEIDGVLMVGVVYDPVSDELFAAEHGEGARLNGVPIRVSACAALVDAMLATGFPYTVREEQRRQVHAFAAFLEEAQAIRRLGSAALDLCYVAAGRFDGYWEERVRPWDIAAGALIVQEAGGTITRLDGDPADVFAGEILATNGVLHPAMRHVLDVERKNRPEP